MSANRGMIDILFSLVYFDPKFNSFFSESK